MTVGSPRTVLTGLRFPEAPRWHDGEIWLSDLMSELVWAVSEETAEARVVCQVPAMPCGLGFLPDGTPLVVSMRSRELFAVGGDGQLHTFASIPRSIAFRLNDMAVDPFGRVYVSYRGESPAFREEEMRAGATHVEGDEGLVLIDERRRVHVVCDGMRGPNGIAISEDGRRLVAVESLGNGLTEFDVESDGGLVGRRQLADFGTSVPDGICLDAEGAVWTGLGIDGCFVRVASGAVVERIDVEGGWAISCVLGGPDRTRLYLVTSETSLPDMALMSDAATRPMASGVGRLQVVRVSVPGAGMP